MIIAVAYEAGNVYQHFGHSPAFKVYTAEKDAVVSSRICETNGCGHGALAGFLKSLGVDALICGGIGGGARAALNSAGILLFPGVSGDADEAVELLLADTLSFDPNTCCDHHGEGHSCSGHSCGSCSH